MHGKRAQLRGHFPAPVLGPRLTVNNRRGPGSGAEKRPRQVLQKRFSFLDLV